MLEKYFNFPHSFGTGNFNIIFSIYLRKIVSYHRNPPPIPLTTLIITGKIRNFQKSIPNYCQFYSLFPSTNMLLESKEQTLINLEILQNL
jgi:hypothetical protein